MTFEELGKLARAKESERRAKLTPEERAEEDHRREREEEEYLAKKDKVVPLLEYEKDIRDLENLIDDIQGENAEQLNMALDKLQAQEAELKAARARIDALLDANLKAQDIAQDMMRRQIDILVAQVKGVKAAAKEGAKEGVKVTLPKVYADIANMTPEELDELTEKKTRSSGGGRKKERDLDDKQVKAVIEYEKAHTSSGLRAACDHIIRNMKESDFKKPYMTAKDLDAAVRRYCKKTSRRIPSKAHHGRWSAKS